MKLRVEINNETDYEISDENIRSVVNDTLEYLADEKLRQKNISLSVALVDADEIEKINEKHRDQAEPTDVLSFGYENTTDVLSGEIILCPSVIEKNAEEDVISFAKELNKNIIHGILHIAGLEHGEKMFAIQEGALLKVMKGRL